MEIKDPKNTSLYDLLDNSIFEVPEYQRAYSWGKKQLSDLFHDINDLKIDGGQDRKHFMATIVCLEKERKNISGQKFENFDIVDGQQRITTLIILLKCLFLHMKDGSEEEKKNAPAINKILIKDENNILVLKSNHDENNVFFRFLNDGVVKDISETTLQSDARIIRAIKRCDEFVREWKKGSGTIALYNYITDYIYFVFQRLTDESSVYTVFEVLNSRGLEVDWLDKTKSTLMGIVYEKLETDDTARQQKLDRLHKIWSEIYREIGRKNIPGYEIIKYAATFKDENQTAKTLTPEDAIEFFKYYCDSADTVIEIASFISEIVTKLKQLYENKILEAVTDISHVRFLYLAIQMRNDLKDEKLKNKLISQWERVSFRIHGIKGKDSRYEVGNFTRLAQWIFHKKKDRNGKIVDFTLNDILPQLKKLGKNYPIEEVLKELKGEDLYEENDWRKELRYFFYKYEKFLSERNDNRQIKERYWKEIWNKDLNSTIEHICPRSFKNEWQETDIRKEDVNRLGNLTILPPEDNKKASDKNFKEKKKIYKRSSLLINEEILNKRKWNKKSILDREKWLYDFAIQTWGDLE